MTFTEAVATCLKKYATFSGTASRSEFLWFYLFGVLVSFVTWFLGDTLQLIATMATLLPTIAAATRRLHDTDRSGWWQLVIFVPFIGLIVLIVFLVQDSKPNRYDNALVPA